MIKKKFQETLNNKIFSENQSLLPKPINPKSLLELVDERAIYFSEGLKQRYFLAVEYLIRGNEGQREFGFEVIRAAIRATDISRANPHFHIIHHTGRSDFFCTFGDYNQMIYLLGMYRGKNEK